MVMAVLRTGTCGGRLTWISDAFSATQLLNRGSLFGPLIGKVKLYLNDMWLIRTLTQARACTAHRAGGLRTKEVILGVKRYPGAALLAQMATPGGQPILRRQPMKAVMAWRASDIHMVSAK
jgi:hypothetical protein